MKSLTDQDDSKVMINRIKHIGAHGNSSMRQNGCCSYPFDGIERARYQSFTN